MPNIQVNHVIQTSQQIQQHARAPKETLTFELVSKGDFRRLFNQHRAGIRDFEGHSYLSDADLFWDHLFGNISEAPHHGLNPKAQYLTTESCRMIFENFEKFISGIDFHHLPQGCLMVKNPVTGVVDVFHYSNYLHILQNQAPQRHLAIKLDDEPMEEERNNAPFAQAAQQQWYQFLQNKRILSNGQAVCSELALRSAFITFSQTVQELGLNFYPPEFSQQLLRTPQNPIVLLGRWEATLKNRHLPISDRQAQWQALLSLRFESSNEAARALSDYEKDNNPCTILLPQMNLTRQDFVDLTSNRDRWGFRSVIDFNAIFSIQDFWRYVAFQPKRQSVEFYREALQCIENLELITQGNKNQLIRLLAAGTTRFNADPDNEAEMLRIWRNICSVINRWETQNPLAYLGTSFSNDAKAFVRNDTVNHVCRLQDPPNFIFLDQMFRYIRLHFSTPLPSVERLINLSNALDRSVSRLQSSFYKGCKFYQTNEDWIGVGIESYTYLQERLSNSYYYQDRNTRDWHRLLAAYFSTFNITDEHSFSSDVAQLGPQNNTPLLTFGLSLLEDIQSNINLSWQDLRQFCQAIQNGELTTQDQILDYLETHLSFVFPEQYFAEKRQYLIDIRIGLTQNQIAFIDRLNFSPEQAIEIKRILNNIRINIPLLTEQEFENLVYKFNDLTQILSSTDTTKFMQHLAKVSSNIIEVQQVHDLLDGLFERRTSTDFEYVYFRNQFIDTRNNLIYKFNLYSQHIASFVELAPDLERIGLQNIVSACILRMNRNPREAQYETQFINYLKGLVGDIAELVANNPHIQPYVFECFEWLIPNDRQDSMDLSLDLAETLLIMQNCLPIDDSTNSAENIHIFYSLLAKYSKNPVALITVMRDLTEARFSSERKHFVLHLMSQLLNAQQSLDTAQDFVNHILELSDEEYQSFTQMYQHPPYVPIQDWMSWIRNQEIVPLERYRAYCREPFGPRRLDLSFKIRQYRKQRSLFKGLIANGQAFSSDIFTDELGQSIARHLHRNRTRDIAELQAIFQNAADNNDIVPLLCAAIEILARTTAQQDINSDRLISQECNTTQVMALYAILTNQPLKTIAEIDTGEGKSRIMMILAACKAAMGKTVDFTTNDMQLAERDFFSYKNFFDTLHIPTSMITLQTPDFLYQKKGVNFSDNAQLLLLRNKSDIDGTPYAYLDEDSTSRCLLLDECDQFIHSKSKDAFNYGAESIKLREFNWVYPHLVRFMQNQAQAAPFSVGQCRAFADNFLEYVHAHDADQMHIVQLSELHRKQPNHLAIWLHSADSALKTMHFDEDYTITEQCFPMKNSDGHMQLSPKILVLNQGRPAPEAIFSDGLHQCLVALENIRAGEERFVIPPECETQRTAYPVTFMAQYKEGNVIGVSGTTRSAGPISAPEINYENSSYLLVPREKPLQREVKNVWVAKDRTQQIAFIKQVIQERLANNQPLLFVCKNDEQSQALYEALSRDPDLAAGIFTRVHSLTNSDDEKNAIARAGRAPNITFSTAGMFSRGVDIVSDNLYCCATYVPSIEDEIQIKGRTARIGKPGTYQMILDLSDPTVPLNGQTYNIDNEIEAYQKKLALESSFQEEISKLYASFLEEITQRFLSSRPADNGELENWLLNWQDLLNLMQKDWEIKRESLLDTLRQQDSFGFETIFADFTESWTDQTRETFPNAVYAEETQTDELTSTIFRSAGHQATFFKPNRCKIKTQLDYDPSDDGQARIYETWFAKTRATLSGKRRWFADYYAWQEGRGALFPNLTATLHGEIPLFPELLIAIKKLLTALAEYFQPTQNPPDPADGLNEDFLDGADPLRNTMAY